MTHKILAVCLDCGDTLVDEATEDKNEQGISMRADLIPGADKLMQALKEKGYPLALVADGDVATFENNLNPYGLYEMFDVYAISEVLGVLKPDAKMFKTALDELAIDSADYGKIVMVGNNLERDIKGANQLGIISVWLDWSPRRSKIPADASEEPQYTIKNPIELMDVLEQLENTL
jgi:HAD superfamily hydrolase (TIGR01549 family)